MPISIPCFEFGWLHLRGALEMSRPTLGLVFTMKVNHEVNTYSISDCKLDFDKVPESGCLRHVADRDANWTERTNRTAFILLHSRM